MRRVNGVVHEPLSSKPSVLGSTLTRKKNSVLFFCLSFRPIRGALSMRITNEMPRFALAANACPAGFGRSNHDWWPNRLDLHILHKNSTLSNPLTPSFHYASEFAKLDFKALKQDLTALMTTSQDWWPADFGNYVP